MTKTKQKKKEPKPKPVVLEMRDVSFASGTTNSVRLERSEPDGSRG